MGYSQGIFLLGEESWGIRKGKQTVSYSVRLQLLKLFLPSELRGASSRLMNLTSYKVDEGFSCFEGSGNVVWPEVFYGRGPLGITS